MPIIPYDESEVLAFDADIQEVCRTATPPIPYVGAVVPGARMVFDATVGMGYAGSRAKHLREFKQDNGIVVPGLVQNLIVQGNFLTLEDGTRFTVIEASDFALLAKFTNGEDITPVLGQRAGTGFNMLRVWTMFDIPGIGAFTTIDYTKIPAFVELCASFRLYVEFTAYTGINESNHWNRLCESARACRIRPLLELVNELDQNTNEPDFMNRVFNLGLYSQPDGVLSSHGSNGSQAVPVRPAWSYETFHTNDASEWWRKTGHNAMEMSEGADGGAGSGVPTITNENTRYMDRDGSQQHAYDAAAGAALLNAGSCFHSVSGKASVLWTPDELACASQWVQGALAVDLQYQVGTYRHAGELESPDDLRVYQRVLNDGRSFTVRIRK